MQVKVEFPADVVVSRFVSAPCWQREVTKDASGKITTVTWSGGQIAPDELGLFQFQACNPASGQVAFKADQTYADKSVVEWTGPAHEVHEIEHDLSRDAYAWLGKLGGLAPTTASVSAGEATGQVGH